ncbi:hypothetical protein SSS_05998 [Sarcoptes scabiei]|uniref:Uncharacterized protein n=1 Tax=Sarcoptes scabiei TaxID=52283 RepID=A0A834RCX0_SARSC|nr:hypothetical protein SSS_05998 [Sarcoptes scabiei]
MSSEEEKIIVDPSTKHSPSLDEFNSILNRINCQYFLGRNLLLNDDCSIKEWPENCDERVINRIFSTHFHLCLIELKQLEEEINSLLYSARKDSPNLIELLNDKNCDKFRSFENAPNQLNQFDLNCSSENISLNKNLEIFTFVWSLFSFYEKLNERFTLETEPKSKSKSNSLDVGEKKLDHSESKPSKDQESKALALEVLKIWYKIIESIKNYLNDSHQEYSIITMIKLLRKATKFLRTLHWISITMYQLES